MADDLRCAHCGVAGQEMAQCPCLAVHYCGVECQRHDWAEHKKVCSVMAERRARQAAKQQQQPQQPPQQQQPRKETPEPQQQSPTTEEPAKSAPPPTGSGEVSPSTSAADNPTPTAGGCGHCGVVSTTLLACPCGEVLYCGAQCQRAEWPTHRKVCGYSKQRSKELREKAHGLRHEGKRPASSPTSRPIPTPSAARPRTAGAAKTTHDVPGGPQEGWARGGQQQQQRGAEGDPVPSGDEPAQPPAKVQRKPSKRGLGGRRASADREAEGLVRKASVASSTSSRLERRLSRDAADPDGTARRKSARSAPSAKSTADEDGAPARKASASTAASVKAHSVGGGAPPPEAEQPVPATESAAPPDAHNHLPRSRGAVSEPAPPPEALLEWVAPVATSEAGDGGAPGEAQRVSAASDPSPASAHGGEAAPQAAEGAPGAPTVPRAEAAMGEDGAEGVERKASLTSSEAPRRRSSGRDTVGGADGGRAARRKSSGSDQRRRTSEEDARRGSGKGHADGATPDASDDGATSEASKTAPAGGEGDATAGGERKPSTSSKRSGRRSCDSRKRSKNKGGAAAEGAPEGELDTTAGATDTAQTTQTQTQDVEVSSMQRTDSTTSSSAMRRVSFKQLETGASATLSTPSAPTPAPALSSTSALDLSLTITHPVSAAAPGDTASSLTMELSPRTPTVHRRVSQEATVVVGKSTASLLSGVVSPATDEIDERCETALPKAVAGGLEGECGEGRARLADAAAADLEAMSVAVQIHLVAASEKATRAALCSTQRREQYRMDLAFHAQLKKILLNALAAL